jgi:hypothetical protein
MKQIWRESVGWIQLAEVRTQLRALDNTIMNLRYPKKIVGIS